MIGLNALISPTSGWVLNTAVGINNAGQIVGQGTFNGQPAGYILTPVVDMAVITSQPPTTVSSINTPFAVTVAAQTAQGNVDASYSATVSVSIASGPAGSILGGAVTENAVNGVASFSGLTLNEPGTYTLQVTGAKLLAANTQVFSVTVPSPPSNLVPGPQSDLRSTVNPSGALVFNSLDGDSISVKDPALTGAALVALSVNEGTLKLGSTAGVVIVKGANNSKAVTLEGTAATLNTALSGLTYTPLATFSGRDTLTLVSSDLGHTSSGTQQSTTSQIAITDGSTTPTIGYTITDLGTLTGGTTSYADGINASGQVSGWSTAADGDWNAIVSSGGVMQDLGTLNLSPYSFASAINDSGETVGWNQQTIGYNQAFVFASGVMQNLGLSAIPLSIVSEALGINNNGDIVGLSSFSGDAPPVAFLYRGGVVTNLGTLPGGSESEAIGVNATDQVVGTSYTSAGVPLAFLYSNGVMQNLGTLGGTQSQANAINDAGEVVGISTTSGGASHAFVYINGVMQDLGTLLGASTSAANGINASGEVVGYSTMANGTAHAFVYGGSTMKDLNSLVAPSSGWMLDYANAVNVTGQIVGEGTVNGAIHAFMLTPVTAGAYNLHAPNVTNASTTENVPTSSGLVITPNAADGSLVTSFQITNITGGTLYLSDGVTPVSNGTFITVSQAAAGLIFSPAANSTATGSFTIQEAITANTTGLGGATTTATVAVSAPATTNSASAAVKTVKPAVASAAASSKTTAANTSATAALASTTSSATQAASSSLAVDAILAASGEISGFDWML